ncbi:MAG: hypothetical protein ACKN83_12245 [Vulcanococcus sp.]
MTLVSLLLLTQSGAQARFDAGGGVHGGGGFSGGGSIDFRGASGGAYRFSAPAVPPAPIQRSTSAASRLNTDGDAASNRWVDQPANRSLEQGYQGSHHLYGAGTRSAWTGHNITADQFRRINESESSRNMSRFQVNRSAAIQNNFYNRNYGSWNNGWGNGGYWGSRPWGYGWYSWTPATWGWWGASSTGWGVAALASADVIQTLVNEASSQQSTVIDVPDSLYQLNYATVDAIGSAGADFSYAVAESPPIKGAANCQQGLLDGQVPTTGSQAQLLNAACQVAYGPDPKGSPLPDSLEGRLPGWLRELLLVLLGTGIGVAGWQLSSKRGMGQSSTAHHAKVTGG